jgi:hypothetical protein
MTEPKLTPEMVKEIKESVHELLLSQFDKPQKGEMVAGGLIPTCCDKCREKDLYRSD